MGCTTYNRLCQIPSHNIFMLSVKLIYSVYDSKLGFRLETASTINCRLLPPCVIFMVCGQWSDNVTIATYPSVVANPKDHIKLVTSGITVNLYTFG